MDPRLDEAPLLDLAHLERQTFGERALEAEVLELFEGQCRRLPPLIADGRSSESADTAHTLKGAARAVGAWRVAGCAERLEAALEEAAPGESFRSLIRALEEAVAETLAAVAVRQGRAA
jgi:HPt (histidine-containing phosphotransfer) domain-containing protein